MTPADLIQTKVKDFLLSKKKKILQNISLQKCPNLRNRVSTSVLRLKGLEKTIFISFCKIKSEIPLGIFRRALDVDVNIVDLVSDHLHFQSSLPTSSPGTEKRFEFEKGVNEIFEKV